MSTKEEFHDKLSEITREHLESVSGGLTLSCSPEQIETITSQVVSYYENLVSATSHIIERVANAVGE
jgi:hypothetical protein